MRYRYLPAGDGRRYCWATRATFRCPLAHDHESPEPPPAVTEAIVGAAELLGCDAGKLRSILERAHGSYETRRARDGRGRLTDRCERCGSRLTRLGFARWIAAPATTGGANGAIAARLGADFVRVEGPWYSTTQKEAAQWARSRAETPDGG